LDFVKYKKQNNKVLKNNKANATAGDMKKLRIVIMRIKRNLKNGCAFKFIRKNETMNPTSKYRTNTNEPFLREYTGKKSKIVI
jgi:hypothetical protein